MFIGHFAVGLGAKKIAPQLNLGLLFIGCQLLDFIWPILVFLNIETVHVDANADLVTPLDFEFYPYSHSLLMGVVYSLLGAGIITALWKSTRAGWVFGATILSHWILDFVSHRPDLPLAFSENKVGLGLWNYRGLTFAIESALFAFGIFLYLRATPQATRPQRIGFWALMVLMGIIYYLNVFGPKLPSDMTAPMIAAPIMGMWVFVLWAYWIDKKKSQTTI